MKSGSRLQGPSVGYRVGKPTPAAMLGNGADAPKAVIEPFEPEPLDRSIEWV
jgi:hypothetical protein